MASNEFPAGYEEMRILSAHMLAAVERDDWRRVAELESQIAALRDHLKTHPVPVTASPEAIAEQKRIISDIILSHQRVSEQALPLLDELRLQLESTNNQRRVNQAYGGNEE